MNQRIKMKRIRKTRSMRLFFSQEGRSRNMGSNNRVRKGSIRYLELTGFQIRSTTSAFYQRTQAKRSERSSLSECASSSLYTALGKELSTFP